MPKWNESPAEVRDVWLYIRGLGGLLPLSHTAETLKQLHPGLVELPPIPQSYATMTHPERSLFRSIIARVEFHHRHHKHYHVIHRVVEGVGGWDAVVLLLTHMALTDKACNLRFSDGFSMFFGLLSASERPWGRLRGNQTVLEL